MTSYLSKLEKNAIEATCSILELISMHAICHIFIGNIDSNYIELHHALFLTQRERTKKLSYQYSVPMPSLYRFQERLKFVVIRLYTYITRSLRV